VVAATPLRFARDTTARGTRRRVRFAARGGKLEMLRWAREHDCPWNAGSAVSSRRRESSPGGAEVGRAHGCPWNKGDFDTASCFETQVLAWVRQQPK
jgi:hypothetical protein